MSTENVKAFLATAKADPKLRAELVRLREAGNLESFAARAIQLGEEKGYDFTKEDLVLTSAEVSDEELEAVAGGGALCHDSKCYPHSGKSFDWNNFVEGFKKLF